MEERHRSLSEVAGLMGVSERTVRRWIKSGKLRAYKPGRDYRIPESAIRELVEESEISPKAFAPPSLFNGLEDERRASWEAAVEDAQRLRSDGRTQMEEALASWRKSKKRGEASTARRAYLDEMGELLQRAYNAETALLQNFPPEMTPRAREAAEQAAGEWIPDPEWEEVREASRFYGALLEMVQGAGLHVRRGRTAHEVEVAA